MVKIATRTGAGIESIALGRFSGIVRKTNEL